MEQVKDRGYFPPACLVLLQVVIYGVDLADMNPCHTDQTDQTDQTAHFLNLPGLGVVSFMHV